jgi:hypothetical protein
MRLEEAIDIRQMRSAPLHLQREAGRVIQLASAMTKVHRGKFESLLITKHEMERINAILAYRLALACGKLNDWRQAA